MEFTAQQIAGLLEGKVQGNLEATVSDMAKIEEGKLELENIEFNLVELLDHLIDLFSSFRVE